MDRCLVILKARVAERQDRVVRRHPRVVERLQVQGGVQRAFARAGEAIGNLAALSEILVGPRGLVGDEEPGERPRVRNRWSTFPMDITRSRSDFAVLSRFALPLLTSRVGTG